MVIEDTWRTSLRDAEERRVATVLENSMEWFDQVAQKLGAQLTDYRAAAFDKIRMDPDTIRSGLVADLRDENVSVLVGRGSSADNTAPRAWLRIIGPCRHCGERAPLEPAILTEHDDDEARARAGLALLLQDPAGGHSCRPLRTIDDARPPGQYL